MPTIRTSLTTLALLGAAAALTACGSMSSPAAPAFNQSSLPATVQVPAGQRIAMETVGAGDITDMDQALLTALEAHRESCE